MVVSHAPGRDPDAARRRPAGADDGCEVGGLRRKRFVVGGQADAKVEFGDGGVDPEACKLFLTD